MLFWPLAGPAWRAPHLSLSRSGSLRSSERAILSTPVITSNTSSLPEVAGDAVLMINPYDENDFSHAMEQIILDDDLRMELSRKGKERAALFSWEKSARMTVEAYQEAIDNRNL